MVNFHDDYLYILNRNFVIYGTTKYNKKWIDNRCTWKSGKTKHMPCQRHNNQIFNCNRLFVTFIVSVECVCVSFLKG